MPAYPADAFYAPAHTPGNVHKHIIADLRAILCIYNLAIVDIDAGKDILARLLAVNHILLHLENSFLPYTRISVLSPDISSFLIGSLPCQEFILYRPYFSRI